MSRLYVLFAVFLLLLEGFVAQSPACKCQVLEDRITTLERGFHHLESTSSSTEKKFAGLFSTVLAKLSTIDGKLSEANTRIQALQQHQTSTEAELTTLANNVTALTRNLEHVHDEVHSVNASAYLNTMKYRKMLTSITTFTTDLNNVTKMAEETMKGVQSVNASLGSYAHFKRNILQNVNQIKTDVERNVSKKISSINTTMETYRLTSGMKEQALNESVTKTIVRLVTLRQKVDVLSNTTSSGNTNGLVFFRAYMSYKNINSENYTLVFDKVRRNYMNAYSGSTGIFLVPRSGIYLFTFDVRTSRTQNTIYQIFKDDTAMSKGFGSLKMSAMFQAQAGNRVYVKTTKPNRFNGGVESIFSGCLLKSLP